MPQLIRPLLKALAVTTALFFLILSTSVVTAGPLPSALEGDAVVVNLFNPTYCAGVLFTQEGGAVQSPTFWLQAQTICYTQTEEEHTLYAQGELLFDYRGQFLRAETLFYDFNSCSGHLTGVRLIAFPWLIGGDEVMIDAKGTLTLTGAYLTPQTSPRKDLIVRAEAIVVSPCISSQEIERREIKARKLTLHLGKLTLMELPDLNFYTDQSTEWPFRIDWGWHGFRGAYIGVEVPLGGIDDFECHGRLDGYLCHGIGAGIATLYDPPCTPTFWASTSYYAYDVSIADPKKRNRYRFLGTYATLFDENTSFDFVYDKVSDAQMASDYLNDDFELDTAQKTELFLHHAHQGWLANLFARAKLNSFQTISQELPTLEFALLPYEIDPTGLVFEHRALASYLDFSFSNEVPARNNFRSGRFEVRPTLYRTFVLPPFTITPQARWIGIYYTHSPLRPLDSIEENQVTGHGVGQSVADLSIDLTTSLGRCYEICDDAWTHVLEPYGALHYLSPPRSSLNQHYIFTVDDAYAKLALLRFGVRQLAVRCGEIPLSLDLYANAFFQKNAFDRTIPKVYLDIEAYPTPFSFFSCATAWNVQKGVIDFFDSRWDWTLSENLALALEYRHRSRYAFRKADFYNYLLEVVRSEEALIHSDLSDRRDLIMLDLFYRLHPNLTTEIELRHGWHRPHESAFFEYQIGIETPIFENFRLGFIFEKKETDTRCSFSLTYAPRPPPRCCM